MKYWLMKSEPEAYSIDNLKADKTTMWEGVRNYQVRNMFRDEMNVGDKALFYHSSAGADTGVVGEMLIHSEAQVDESQFDKTDSHYDPKSTKDKPRWWCPQVKFLSKFPRLVTLEEIKELKEFKDSKLIQKGNRLSVIQLTKKQYEKIITLSKK